MGDSDNAARCSLLWLLSEMEREGLRRSGQERLLALLLQLVSEDSCALRPRALRSAMRAHVASSLLLSMPPTDVRRALPQLCAVSRATAYRDVSAALSALGPVGG